MGTKGILCSAAIAGVFALAAIAQQSGAGAGAGSAGAGAAGNSADTGKMSSGKMSSGAGKASSADTKFANEAAIGGLAEVEMGRMATQKASNDRVKQFGQRMVDDHSKANDELKSIASKNSMTLPTDLDAKHKALSAKLSNLSGDAFDKAYISEMVKDHEKDVALFRKESTGGSGDLKEFAAKTLPTLEEHLTMVREIQTSMKSGGKGGNMSNMSSGTSSGSNASGAAASGNSGSGSGAAGNNAGGGNSTPNK